MVKDVMGEPLIGANVVEKGRSTNGVITDFNGYKEAWQARQMP